MVSESRSVRIADRIHRELSLLFLNDIEDPRLEGVSVTHVKVDRELAFADIYVSALEGKERLDEIMAGLEHAKGFLRSELAHHISHLRTFPQLRFHWDLVPERADRIEQLIAELDTEEEGDENASGE
ncbi:MAG: 30S ribosome-binding factor RbfA [Anaerolineales bacterium]